MQTTDIIQMGLRAIDFLFPLRMGGNILVSGDPKSGIRVLAQEIAERLANHPVTPFRVTFFIDEALPDSAQVLAEINQTSLSKVAASIIKGVSLADTVASIQGSKGKSEALFAVSNDPRYVELFHQALRHQRTQHPSRSLTTFSVIEGIAQESILGSAQGDYDVRLISSRTIAQEAIYPAIDSRRSSSNGMTSSSISDHHRQLAAQIKKGLDETIENLYEGAVNDEDWFFNSDPDGRPWVQLLCFMSQNYFVAEPYTGAKGAFVPLMTTLESLESIFAGELSELPAKFFRFKNQLSEIEGVVV